MENISEALKRIRKANNLTQKSFARRFFVTEKTVSNYENGVRAPSIEFLLKVCKEFNINMDYLFEKKQNTSRSKDLVCVEKNEKLAIFDKKQGVYLTPFIYDYVVISPYGYHVVANFDDIVDMNKVYKNVGEQVFCGLMDNDGNVRKLEGFEFAYIGHFCQLGVCSAVCKENKKQYLINHYGKVLSEGYERLIPVDDHGHYGLYYGINMKENFKLCDDPVEKIDLLNYTGEKINVEFEDIQVFEQNLIAKNLNRMSRVTKYINSYGLNILKILPNNVFEKASNYVIMLKEVINYLKQSLLQEEPSKSVLYAIKILKEKAAKLNPKVDCKLEQAMLDFTANLPVKNVEKFKITNQLHKFYIYLGL